ncbi:NEW3 domain-containing protein [Kitasatospora nipponensis]|uniref:NEW3 domain-containing protein n=1 Tax=Kitasatospora nipponensis TaxID=258049 RepID=A0ABP4GX91_9ACTN
MESTDLFVRASGRPGEPRPSQRPAQVLRVRLGRKGLLRSGPLSVTAAGPGLRQAHAVHLEADTLTRRGEAAVLELPILVESAPTGRRLPLEVTVSRADGAVLARGAGHLTVAEPGWTMYLVPHFHYDPVWWNTQAAYTCPSELLAADGTTRRLWENNAFALIDAHLELAARETVYTFVLAEIDYLKPYFDTHPERLAELRALLAEGRVELLGGTYNEPNTNLTGAETTIRNIVYGVGYQRDILGGDPRTAWQLDVFGHDPQFPGYLADAGLTGSAWARGPFHQWGPVQKNFREAKGDATLMQFPSEFEWIAPSGKGVLTHYMPHHYSAGWWMDSSATLAEAEQAVHDLFRILQPVGATRNLLLPVGTDYTPPNRWVTAIHHDWNARYLWPRFVCGTPRDFLTAVRTELAERGVQPSPQSRDMNPIYTGKDVSYIDTKQAQRAGEVAATDAEKLATLAALLGEGRYPEAAMDKVWRQLAYGAHHDAITGSESDQVYLDLLTGWREAYDLAGAVREAVAGRLTARIDTRGEGTAVVVLNTMSFPRSGPVRIEIDRALLPAAGYALRDDRGERVPLVLEAAGERSVVLGFRAEQVPGIGWRSWRLVADEAAPTGWLTLPADEGWTIANEHYRITVDPARGGAVSSLVDLATDREVLQPGRLGNELMVHQEYSAHPDMGEGPWHLLPTGAVTGSASAPAEQVRVERSGLGSRIVVTGTVAEVRYEQTLTLHHGGDRLDLRTRVLDFTGADRLLRVRFPVDVEGGLPLCEVAAAVIGRGFALPDVDSAQQPWTLDNPANTWFGLGSTVRIEIGAPSGERLGARAVAIAEVVVDTHETGATTARELVVALARAGVTATTSSAAGSRYGWLEVDSNLPDVRILLGGPTQNALTAELLAGRDPAYRAELERQLAAEGSAALWVPADRPLREVWQPGADLRDLAALPALVLAGTDGAALVRRVARAVEELADARITATTAGPGPVEQSERRTVALLTYGLPGFAVDPTGALHLSLMRSCTGWPSGIWLDPPRRTVPDGSGFQLQHWTHDFDYALVAGDGDWRELRLPSRGQEFSTPLIARALPGSGGDLPARHELLAVEPARDVLLATLKPTGNPIARGSAVPVDPAAAVTLRLAESTGTAGTARVRSALPLGAARRANLLEVPGEPLPGLGQIALGGFEVATVTAGPAYEPGAGSVSEAGPEAESESVAPGRTDLLGPAGEVVRAVYARYWLHNKGPAPMGYLPVSVTLDPAVLYLPAPPAGTTAGSGPEATVEVVLRSQLRDAAVEGVVDLLVPDGWSAEPPSRVFGLAPDGHQRFTVTLRPGPGAVEGIHFVSARLTVAAPADPANTVEDVLSVVLGDDPQARLILPAAPVVEERAQPDHQGVSEEQGRPTGLDVEVLGEVVEVGPGGHGEFRLRLANRTAGEIRAEVQLVSPWGTWTSLPVVTRPALVPAHGVCEVGFAVTPPPDHPGGAAWVLAKVMWFGRVQYSACVPLRIGAVR